MFPQSIMPPSSVSSSPKRVGFSVFGKLDREWSEVAHGCLRGSGSPH